MGNVLFVAEHEMH